MLRKEWSDDFQHIVQKDKCARKRELKDMPQRLKPIGRTEMNILRGANTDTDTTYTYS